jgi:SpoVK/Ycf46/Vps4 family AAA+-type ATPase
MSKENYKYGDPFKFKSLKVYSSPEWMANSTKKYRKVFDKAEVSYIRWEFTFYNKLFDEEDWKGKINIKAFDIDNGKRTEICNLEENCDIKKDQNEIQIYKSWGVDDNAGFWKKSQYLVEAYIDDKLVGSERFYIEDVGVVSPKSNPYFDIESIKLYTGSSNAWELPNKVYLTAFNKIQTKYVWVELKIKNKTNSDWNFEFFLNFYDDAGQFKAQIESLYYVEKGKKEQTIIYQRGWGNDEPGSWKDDKYSVELVFMDTLIAATQFEMGEKDIEGESSFASVSHSALLSSNLMGSTEEDDVPIEELMKKLEELIGLENVKNQIKEHISYIDFLKLRKEKGLQDEETISLHSVFTGNPGTGKTTVVKLLGKIYKKMGLLSKGHVHEVDRADLVGEYIGQTAPKIKDNIEKARGGILFIDEAYALARTDDTKDFGREVIEIIIKEMSDGPGDIAIMAAGYPKEMQSFVDFNPGLKSRFKYYFHFEDYTPDELIKIAEFAAKKRHIIIDGKAMEYINKLLVEAYRNRDRSFGNARFAYALIDEGKMNLGLRLIKDPDVKNMDQDTLSTITYDDVKNIKAAGIKKEIRIPIDEDLLKLSTFELNRLVGMEQIKNEVNDLIKLVRYYRETGKDVLNRFSLHTIFTGNPGTGKTTLARIVGKIYKALGLLERGHVVETGREGLIAGYVGQTALKTKEKLEESMGGVLFVDEAYALSDGAQNDFGKEAVEVILKTMEDERGKFAVIAAGYPDNMNVFLHANPGLKSRFDRVWHFYDYTPEILFQIAVSMFDTEGLKLDESAEKYLNELLNQLYNTRDKFFGNARSIRKIVEQAVKKQNLRMASLPSEERTESMMEQVSIMDLQDIAIDEKNLKERKSMGFKS